jgi:hypothetical protein
MSLTPMCFGMLMNLLVAMYYSILFWFLASLLHLFRSSKLILPFSENWFLV